ncbi:MAG TPA: DUF3455 domain-containing protein [Xanthobacteraceae bacterium]|nr:DUF3455 domain-containing protein [Xanthobacteraceae bacterium]
MITSRFTFTILVGCSAALGQTGQVAAQTAIQIPDAITAKGETVVLTVHAVGAQVYDCKAGDGGKLAWQFREPIATLIQDGKTVGRHYAGPTWEHADGSRVVGKLVARANGATAQDIPWLKLEAVETRSAGALTGVTTIQRINTKGGQFEGACDKVGAMFAAPYAADYVFLKK